MSSSTSRNPKAKKADQKVANSADRRAELARQRELEQAAARRKKILWIMTGVVALALVLGGIGWAVWSATRPNSVVPAQMSVDRGGIAVDAEKAKPDAPEVRLFNDFQCGNCKVFEAQAGEKLRELAKSGDIKLSLHTMQFLDASIPGKNSHRSAVASACAADVGLYHEYVKAAYATAPEEGKPVSDAHLTDEVTAAAGITGDKLTTFKKCYADKKYERFVNDADQANAKWLSDRKLGVSTPTLTAGDKKVDLTTIKSVDALLEAIKATK